MSISEIEVRFTASDLEELLTALKPAGTGGGIESLRIGGGKIQAGVRFDGFPAVPVNARVARVEPQELVLDLELGTAGLLPQALEEKALDFFGNRMQVPGLRFEGSRLHLALGPLLDRLPARFTLAEARVEGETLKVALRDLTWTGGTSGGLTGVGAAPTTAAAEPDPAAAEPDPAVAGPGEPEPAAATPSIPASDAAAGLAAGDRVEEGTEGKVVPMPRPERTVPPEHQGTYKGLRSRIEGYLDRSLPSWMQPAVPWLLLLPDFVVLLARLAVDRRVPARAKVLAGAALAYLALPLDLVPDVLPLVGLLDDLALVFLALDSLVALSPRAVVEEHWPGEENVIDLIRDGLTWAGRYFPRGLIGRLREWLRTEEQARADGAAQGVAKEAAQETAAPTAGEHPVKQKLSGTDALRPAEGEAAKLQRHRQAAVTVETVQTGETVKPPEGVDPGPPPGPAQ